MTAIKTATLNLRIKPALKQAAKEAAMKQDRSVASLIEALIRQHCNNEGIPVHDQADLFGEN